MRRLPAPLRAALSLERGERALASAPTRGGSHVVATTTALHIPTASGGFRRIPWEHIDHAAWESDHLRLQETGGDVHRVGLTEPRAVPETVHERVTSTIVISTHNELPSGAQVRIAGRRAPSGGDVQWTFLFEQGADPSDPRLRAEAERALATLRERTGL